MAQDIFEEKQVLAAFISQLPEAILICDPQGRVLIHDQQSQAYLCPDRTGKPTPLAGRPITAWVDQPLVEHALDEINQGLKQGDTAPASFFILRKKERTFHARMVPVLSESRRFQGFVLILDDITHKVRAEEQVDGLLRMLSQNARSPMASIRAAIEAMKAFPGMDKARQHQFTDIIYNESLVLSQILESVSRDYSSLVHARTALKPVRISDLVHTAARRARSRIEITCSVTPGPDDDTAWIRADRFSLIQGLLLILEQLARETGLKEFHLSFRGKNSTGFLDMAWEGPSLAPQKVRQWESLGSGTREASMTDLKEILHQHQAAVWLYPPSPDHPHQPFLRLFIPLCSAPEIPAFDLVPILPESFLPRDRETAVLPEQALDQRLMTELSYTAMIREIHQASAAEELAGKHSQLPRLIHSMLTSGTKVKTVTWLITAFSDAILNKLIEFSLVETGPPPVPFAFITLGSEGRKEQTLKTDQDNALIFRDPEPGRSVRAVQDFFLALGEKVCTRLNRCGYDFCKGGIMAKNPQWCQPLSVWKSHFSDWIHAPSPRDLRHATIFFDLRHAWGDPALTRDLINHLYASLANWPGFFRNMAENAIYFKPPIGLFGRIQVIGQGPFKHCVDIKMANLPMVDLGRIYALKHGIRETCTQDRLYRLYLKRVVTRKDYTAMEQAYGFLMQLRFMAQTRAILAQHQAPDNFINPKTLSPIEKQMLKQILKQMKTYQEQLAFDFIGTQGEQIS